MRFVRQERQYKTRSFQRLNRSLTRSRKEAMMTHESLIKTFMKKHRLTFKNPRLLERALTHSSYVNELKESNVKDNERLEFLGDAVLELAISRYLFLKLPNAEEGELSKLRAQYVC